MFHFFLFFPEIRELKQKQQQQTAVKRNHDDRLESIQNILFCFGSNEFYIHYIVSR